jgi:hypothetical protein
MILLVEMKHIQRLDAMEIQKSFSVKGDLRPLYMRAKVQCNRANPFGYE